ncbi:hypothetical protein MJO29_000014 [Puccinia striiformis f. sp. tritici]|nr:hypothetical protein MJO29_000014 [Puccinia striiformis f. sp. tritici]
MTYNPQHLIVLPLLLVSSSLAFPSVSKNPDPFHYAPEFFLGFSNIEQAPYFQILGYGVLTDLLRLMQTAECCTHNPACCQNW